MLSTDHLQAVPPIQFQRRHISRVDGKRQSPVLRCVGHGRGAAHENIGQPVAATLRDQSQIDQLGHVGAQHFAQEHRAQRIFVFAKQKPMLRIKITGGAVAGENIVDGAQAVESGAVETVLIGRQNRACKKFMARLRIRHPLAVCRQLRLGHFCDHRLQVKQFREFSKPTGKQNAR